MALFSFLRKQAKPPQGAALNRIWSQAPNSETYSLPDLFHKTPRLDPIDLIAQTIADSNLEIFDKIQLRKDGDEAEPIQGHPLLDLLDMPCHAFPELDGYIFKYLTVALSELLGEVFWIKIRGGRQIDELLIFPPSWCTSTPTQGDPSFLFYPFGVTSQKPFRVAPTDVVWFKMPNAVDPYARGRGRTEAMGDELDTDEMSAKWQKNFFYNDATPPVIVSIPGATQIDLERARDTWSQKVGGWLNARKPAFIGGAGADVTKLSDTGREMEFIESRKYLRDSFLQHYSIPPELFGIIENSNRATIDSAFYLFAKNVISRRLGFYERAITNQLLRPDFDNRLVCKFDFEIPTDEAFKLQVANEGFSRGTITRAEWRKSMGYPVDKTDDVFLLPFSLMEVPRGQPMEQPEPEPEGTGINIIDEPTLSEIIEEPPKKAKYISVKELDARRAMIYKAFDQKAREGEGMFRARVRAFAAEQKKRAIKAIKADPEHADEAIKDIFGDKSDESLMHSLAPAWISSMTDGSEQARDFLSKRKGISFDLYNKLFDAWVKENGLKKAKEINETTYDELRKKLADQLAEGVQEGESIEDLADRLIDECDGVYSNMSGYRAEMIARTETIASVNFGTQITYKMEGVEKKEWLASPGGDAASVRTDHQVGVGYGAPLVVGIDEPFDIGGEELMYPGDPSGSAGNVINCRCTIIPVLED